MLQEVSMGPSLTWLGPSAHPAVAGGAAVSPQGWVLLWMCREMPCEGCRRVALTRTDQNLALSSVHPFCP